MAKLKLPFELEKPSVSTPVVSADAINIKVGRGTTDLQSAVDEGKIGGGIKPSTQTGGQTLALTKTQMDVVNSGVTATELYNINTKIATIQNSDAMKSGITSGKVYDYDRNKEKVELGLRGTMTVEYNPFTYLVKSEYSEAGFLGLPDEVGNVYGFLSMQLVLRNVEYGTPKAPDGYFAKYWSMKDGEQYDEIRHRQVLISGDDISWGDENVESTESTEDTDGTNVNSQAGSQSDKRVLTIDDHIGETFLIAVYRNDREEFTVFDFEEALNGKSSIDIDIIAERVEDLMLLRHPSISGEFVNHGLESHAYGEYSHAEGCRSRTNQAYSHAEGYWTLANNQYEHAQGIFNNSHNGNYNEGRTLYSVGCGSEDGSRHNAHEIMRNGDHWLGEGKVYLCEYREANKGKDLKETLSDYNTRIRSLESMGASKSSWVKYSTADELKAFINDGDYSEPEAYDKSYIVKVEANSGNRIFDFRNITENIYIFLDLNGISDYETIIYINSGSEVSLTDSTGSMVEINEAINYPDEGGIISIQDNILVYAKIE